MTMSRIDRADATPLYHQLFLHLRDEILQGRRAFGSSLPTEAELAEQQSVSRVTARRALEELSRSGLVERKRRIGTRVTFESPVQPLEANVSQAVETLVAFGRKTSVQVIDISEGPADAEVALALALPAGTPVVHAKRLRSLDGQPLGMVSVWMPVGIAAHISLAGLASTPILALLQDSGLTFGSARQMIGADVADPALAALLDVSPRSPILWIERILNDQAGAPALLTRASYRADRYRITLDLGADGETVGLGVADQPTAPA